MQDDEPVKKQSWSLLRDFNTDISMGDNESPGVRKKSRRPPPKCGCVFLKIHMMMPVQIF